MNRQSLKSTCINLLGFILRLIPLSLFENFVKALLYARLGRDHSTASLATALKLDNVLYGISGQLSVTYGQGNHVKHRLTNYIEDFSIKATELDGPYLDIGCGLGVLSNEIAKRTTEKVTGIEIISDKIAEAKQRYDRPNLEFIADNAITANLDGSYKTIILSNVLEHIEKRPEFLKSLTQKYAPSTFLIRVPLFERDWRVPLKKELNIEWRLDDTHYTEHTWKEFLDEMLQSNLTIQHAEIKWGEIWAVITPKKEAPN